ncbi:MAG TPA: DUF3078 domain-containing protein [Bacteroidetes bacterium]|nr:DUF3078 domain-containing protein [Bacteroidota bacterium]
MKRKFLLFFILAFSSSIIVAQEIDIDALKAKVTEKKAMANKKQGEADALKAEIATLQKQIDMASGWRYNTSGVLGFTLAGFQNWTKQANPNSKVSNISGVFKGSAIMEKPKYFWRNEGIVNVGWQKLVIDSEDTPKDDQKYNNVADIFSLTSLFGYKITSDIAASVLGQYNSSIVNNFNNPGILDLGAGATWTPHQIPNLVLTVHPLNYHLVFQKGDVETKKALGAKIFAGYFANLYKGIKWNTDFSGFLEYGSSDPSLNEYTWNNTLSLPAFHGIGIGIGFGLRKSALESEKLQSYYNLGLSYNL